MFEEAIKIVQENMVRLFTTVSLCIFCYTLPAQGITGSWEGKLEINNGMKLRVRFNVSNRDGRYFSTLDSPDQGAKGVEISSTTFVDSKVQFVVTSAQIVYEGRLDEADPETITGTFSQRGQVFPLKLRRVDSAAISRRVQDPMEPYPYLAEEVVFVNSKDSVKLSGTFTVPRGKMPFPAVVLISGSGPQNRDEEVMGHKPFLVLADFLARSGIAALRFDDRGVGKSTGTFSGSTTVDFSNDVEAAVHYLHARKEVDKRKVGLIGHSEGGLIAQMLAGNSSRVSFIVLMASPGLPGDEILLTQQRLMGLASGYDENSLAAIRRINENAFRIVKAVTDDNQLEADLRDYFLSVNGSLTDSQLRSSIVELTNPWMKHFLRYNPQPALRKIHCPVLAINGSKDLQVAARENLAAIQAGLVQAGNRKVAVKEMEGLNHLFQECKTGLPSEYGEIEQTIAPHVLNEIKNWILDQE